MKKPTLSIILPTYNEKGNINRLITAIKKVVAVEKIAAELIVVDDNSPDNTARAVQRAFKNDINIKTIIRKKEKGLATAIKYGVNKATGDFVLVMDTDFNHDPKEIPTMRALIKKSRLVIGSRYVKNGGMENKLRQWLSYLFNLYLRILLNHETHDNLSGFFIMRRKDLLSLNLNSVFYGFGEYFIRLIHAAHGKNFTIVETPVFYKNRSYGKSKSRFLHMFVTYSLCALKLRFNFI